MSGRWVDLREAAELLGTSTEAVRKRASRGSLRSEKRDDGRVVVWVDDDRTEGGREAQGEGYELLVEVLREEVAHLRRESERKDTIIMSLSQSNAEMSRTIRALEPPPSGPAHWAEDEEALREDRGMEVRDDETRQRWHSRRHGSPRSDDGQPEPYQPGEEVTQDSTNGAGGPGPQAGDAEAPAASEHVPWWRRMFGG